VDAAKKLAKCASSAIGADQVGESRFAAHLELMVFLPFRS
jgi:hypothetical protein